MNPYAVAGLPTEIDLPAYPVDGLTVVVQQPVFVAPPLSHQPITKTKIAPTPKRIPWLPIVGGVVLAVLLAAALLILPNQSVALRLDQL